MEFFCAFSLLVRQSATTCSGSTKLEELRISALMTLKIAAFDRIPSASVILAIPVNAGFFHIPRTASRKSCRKLLMVLILLLGQGQNHLAGAGGGGRGDAHKNT